jgi:hypothetical protein
VENGSHPSSPKLPEANRPETRSWQSLPDAPTLAQPTSEASGAAGAQEIQPALLTPPPHLSFTAPDLMRGPQNHSSDSFSTYLVFQTPKPDPAYSFSTNSSFLGRASDAASSTFLIRTPSGRPRLNTAYVLGMLALAAVHTAYRPYWQRTGGAVAGDFGVTIGSNAGINVFHAFEPAIMNKTRSFTPKFLYKLEQRATGSQSLRDSLSTSGQ